MAFSVRDAAAWKKVTDFFVRDAGVWKEVSKAWVRDAGVWKEFFASFGGFLQTTTVTSSSVAPTDADATFKLSNDGSASSTINGLGQQPEFTWLLDGAVSDYECRWVATGDTADLVLGNVNVWENLGTTRIWTLRDSSQVGVPKEVTGTLELGLAGLNTAEVSATLTLRAQESP